MPGVGDFEGFCVVVRETKALVLGPSFPSSKTNSSTLA